MESTTIFNELLQRGELIPVIGMMMGGLLLIVVTCGLMCMGFIKAITGGGATRDRRMLEHQETESFQELARGFRRMEERLDSLETLLIGHPNRPATDHELREL